MTTTADLARARRLTLAQRLLLEQTRAFQPTAEHVFAAPRRFRIDVAFVAQRLAVEIQGGIWTGGRHVRGAGMRRDCEKSALLAIHGWRLINCTVEHVETGDACAWIAAALAGKGDRHDDDDAPEGAPGVREHGSGQATRDRVAGRDRRAPQRHRARMD